MDRPLITPSPASTYLSEPDPVPECSQKRRSLRLIDKENRLLANSRPKCRSPQLFGDTEEEISQIPCHQSISQDKIAHLKPSEHKKGSDKAELPKALGEKALLEKSPSKALDKILHLKPSESILRSKSDNIPPSKPSTKVLNLKQEIEVQKSGNKYEAFPSITSTKVLHLKPQNEVQKSENNDEKAAPSTNRKRKGDSPMDSKAGPKRKPTSNLQSTSQNLVIGTSTSTSKLPLQYPSHFIHQLPHPKDTSFVHQRRVSAQAIPVLELCATPEPKQVTPPSPSSSPHSDSESSLVISLSDSIGEVFGTKDIGSILKVEKPRQYILIEDHLPALATMMNVELSRLRSVLNIIQGLTHEQILNFPAKRENDNLLINTI
ncbi:hypothetical protein KR009_011437 [Drosophila setifemur]|nr:hypothetical protein KR009_011437 [Drosophila setifemur]